MTARDRLDSDSPHDRPSLLHRAGVIGAESIAADDPGNAFIPVAVPPSEKPDDGARAESGIPEHEMARWRRVGATPTTAATLRRLGADPAMVGAAVVSADELVGWLWHGFSVDEIVDWIGAGSVRIAAQRRDAGLAPGEN